MNTIGDLIGKSEVLQKRLAEHRERLLSNGEVSSFIKENEGLLDDDAIERSLSRINEFVVRQNDPFYEPKLVLIQGLIDVIYKPRDEALANKQAKGIRQSSLYDEMTSQFRGYHLDDYEVDRYNIKPKTFADDFCSSYQYGSGFTGMWLCGQKGIGKSFLMACLAGSLSKRNVGVAFVNTATMLDTTMTSLKNYSEDKQKVLDRYKKAEVLILDDIGTEYLTGWIFGEILYQIINYRHSHNLATFFTSNYTIQDYTDMVSRKKDLNLDAATRLKARIDGLAVEVQMVGTDRREKAQFNQGV